jgi:hypothetical protein
MKILTYLKDKFPFELKRSTSIASIIIALIISGIFTRLGEIILENIIFYFKPYLPNFWTAFLWVMSVSFEINLIGAIVFIIMLFPIYRKLDKLLLNRFKNEIVFKDDFHAGNKGWILNYWRSKNPLKTNRIENSIMIFEATENDLVNSNKEFGAYIDLRNGIYRDCSYEISCKVKSEKETTMQFKLWLHDTKGGASNIETPLKTPSTSGEILKLKIKANVTEAIRIHLHNKAGEGKILVEEVVARNI